MPYLDHVYVAFGGQLNEIGTADEIWQCGVRVAPGDITQGHFAQADLQTYLNDVTLTLSAWFTDPASHMSSQSSLGYLKINNINAAGKYADANTNEHLYSPPIAGGDNTQGSPGFCSNVLSFRSAALRGFGTHGRIYPPNFGASLFRGSIIAEQDWEDIAASAVGLIDLLRNTSGTVHATPIIASATGVNGRIARAGAGNVVDYQSRRKNAVPEVYRFAPAPSH